MTDEQGYHFGIMRRAIGTSLWDFSMTRCVQEYADRMYLGTCRLQTVSAETLGRLQADGYTVDRGDVELLYGQTSS